MALALVLATSIGFPAKKILPFNFEYYLKINILFL
jgi:hypothetical protein